ncbi:MAG: hypothetical protein IKD87_08550 [Oscillospiraceae bacterium]|nr:hypothetical protein [Oscillospiraceae bacterium]
MKRFLAFFLCALMICSISMVFAEEDSQYEWANGATQNDNHFGYVQLIPDSKTHELVEVLDNYGNGYASARPGDKLELTVPEPVGDDLEGLTYKWSLTRHNPESEIVPEELDSVTDTITTEPIPEDGSISYMCTVTDKFGNTADYFFNIRVILYEIDPEEAEYVKGSGKDLVFTITSIVGKENIKDRVMFVYFDYVSGFEKDEETGEEVPTFDYAELSLDHLSEDENGLKVTIPAELLDEAEESEELCWLSVYFEDSDIYAPITIVEPIADTDDVTDTALYAVIAVTSLVAIAAVVIGKKKLSVR